MKALLRLDDPLARAWLVIGCMAVMWVCAWIVVKLTSAVRK